MSSYISKNLLQLDCYYKDDCTDMLGLFSYDLGIAAQTATYIEQL